VLKFVAVLKFQPMAILYEPCEEFIAVQSYINDPKKMESFKDMIAGEV
jgi:hypothetical protein